MSRLLIFICIISALALAADAQKPQPKTDAQKYAAALADYLAKIDAELASKRKAEKDYYTATADAYEAHYSDDLLQTLTLERRERGEGLADQVLAKSAPLTLTALRMQMLEQSRSEIVSMRKFADDERAIRSAYLSGVTQLDANATKVKALRDSLDQLSLPKSGWGNIKDLGTFGEEAGAAYTKLKCGDVKKEIDQLTKQKAELEKVTNPSNAQTAKLKSIANSVSTDQKYLDNSCKDSSSGGGGN